MRGYHQKRHGGTDLNVWNNRPRRVSEIWKLDRKTNTVIALGLEGIVQLNALGSAIWLQLDGKHTISDIVEKLVQAYPERDQNRIKVDIISFIENLAANRLVVLDWHPLQGERSLDGSENML